MRMTYIHATPSSYTHAIHVYLRMRGTVNWWAGWSILPFYCFTDSWSLTSLLRVCHRVATLLDSTRESILALRYNFWRLQGTQSCRGRPLLICILALSLVFTPYLSNAVVSAKSPLIFHALVALKLLVSLISRLVACSARIVVDRQTNRQTDTQTNYCNPRCACAPRLNYFI